MNTKSMTLADLPSSVLAEAEAAKQTLERWERGDARLNPNYTAGNQAFADDVRALLKGLRQLAHTAQPAEVEKTLPAIDAALAYSRNFAEASPYLTKTAKEHILGLCNLLEAREAKRHAASAQAVPQHTICAGCGIDKPTPLRVDSMGGYVCLTCIDKKLHEAPPPAVSVEVQPCPYIVTSPGGSSFCRLAESVQKPASASALAQGQEAPPNSLPSWGDCALRVDNSNFIAKRVAEGGYGSDPDSLLATELHRFIYEYDDSDPFKSAWFLHRLELVLKEATQQPASAQAVPVATVKSWVNGSYSRKYEIEWHSEVDAGAKLYTESKPATSREVPEGVLKMLSVIEEGEQHDANGPGRVYCPACDAETSMVWSNGHRVLEREVIQHRQHCPAEWARSVLAAATAAPKEGA